MMGSKDRRKIVVSWPHLGAEVAVDEPDLTKPSYDITIGCTIAIVGRHSATMKENSCNDKSCAGGKDFGGSGGGVGTL
jgi:hypothetical protein